MIGVSRMENVAKCTLSVRRRLRRGHVEVHVDVDSVKEHYGISDDCIHGTVLRVPPEKKANPLSIAVGLGNGEIIEMLHAAGAVAHVQSAKIACPTAIPLNDRTIW